MGDIFVFPPLCLLCIPPADSPIPSHLKTPAKLCHLVVIPPLRYSMAAARRAPLQRELSASQLNQPIGAPSLPFRNPGRPSPPTYSSGTACNKNQINANILQTCVLNHLVASRRHTEHSFKLSTQSLSNQVTIHCSSSIVATVFDQNGSCNIDFGRPRFGISFALNLLISPKISKIKIEPVQDFYGWWYNFMVPDRNMIPSKLP